MSLSFKGVRIGYFENLEPPDSRLKHRTNQAEIDACAHCEIEHCVCNYTPNPPLRRCALERHLDDRNGERSKRPDSMLTVSAFARLAGVAPETINKRRWLGWYPGARKIGGRWAYPRNEARNGPPRKKLN